MISLGMPECGHMCPVGMVSVTGGEACGTSGTRGAGDPAAAPGPAEAPALSWRPLALPHGGPCDRRCQRIHGIDGRAGLPPPDPGRVLRDAPAGGHRRVHDRRRELPLPRAGAAAQAAPAPGRVPVPGAGVGADRRGLRAAGVGGRSLDDGTRRRRRLDGNWAGMGHGDQLLRRCHDDRPRAPVGDRQLGCPAGPPRRGAAGELIRPGRISPRRAARG